MIIMNDVIDRYNLSYPARGMGIEIESYSRRVRINRSYPARGMGIEMLYLATLQPHVLCHTPRGVWGLKLTCQARSRGALVSYPARGMGIEMSMILLTLQTDVVIPREGYGD